MANYGTVKAWTQWTVSQRERASRLQSNRTPVRAQMQGRNVGVLMSGTYDNRATIVAPSSRVQQRCISDALACGASGEACVVVYS